MSPPTISTLWREQDASVTQNNEPFIVDGHHIPRGTQVGINLYALFHNEEYFPDSFTWRPERWLGSEDSAHDLMHKAFVPFILGDRSCAGRTMAIMEASLTLARTLWYFDFEKASGEAGEVGGGKTGRTNGRHRPGEFQLFDIFAAQHQGPNLVFSPRGEFWKRLLTKG